MLCFLDDGEGMDPGKYSKSFRHVDSSTRLLPRHRGACVSITKTKGAQAVHKISPAKPRGGSWESILFAPCFSHTHTHT